MKPKHLPARKLADLPAPGWLAVTRGAALGLALLFTLNLLEVTNNSTSAVENWLCDLQPAPQQVAVGILAMAATCLLLFAMRPALPGPVWLSASILIGLMIASCGREIWQIQQTVLETERATALTRPLGVLMLFVVAGIGIVSGNRSSVQGRSSFIAILTSTVFAVVGFAVVTIQSGALSDSTENGQSSMILVAGCQPNIDGNPSDELSDRVRTGAQLWSAKKGRGLFFSGGPGNGDISEADAMKTLGIETNVPPEAIVINTNDGTLEQSVAALAALPDVQKSNEVIIVSHWYELARCRMLARRAGLSCTAVAAEQEHALFGQNMLVAREVGALLKTLAAPALQMAKGFSGKGSDQKSPVTTEDFGSDADLDGDLDADLDAELEKLRSMEL